MNESKAKTILTNLETFVQTRYTMNYPIQNETNEESDLRRGDEQQMKERDTFATEQALDAALRSIGKGEASFQDEEKIRKLIRFFGIRV